MRVKNADQQAIMAKYGMEIQAVKVVSPIFEHDFSDGEKSTDLIAFQRRIVAEAFAEEVSLKNYHIKPDAMNATRQSVLDVADGIFTRFADADMGPWAAARAYCRMRLEEAQQKDLEDSKKRVLESIREKYLSNIASHEDLNTFEAMALMQLDALSTSSENKVQEAPEIMINRSIRKTLADAASFLLDAKQEVAATAVAETPAAETAAASNEELREDAPEAEESVAQMAEAKQPETNEQQPANVEVPIETCQRLVKEVRSKNGKLDVSKFIQLSDIDRLALFRFAGIKQEDLVNPDLFHDNVNLFSKFIANEEEDC